MESSAVKYINITLHKSGPQQDKTEMRLGKNGRHFTEFVGQLVGMYPPKFKTREGDLPDRYEYGILLKAMDPEDNQVRTFLLQLSSHWKSPIVSDIINPLAWVASNPDHNKLVRISVYSKKPKDGRAVMRAKVTDGNSLDTQTWLPAKYPWVGDHDNGKFEGVPEPTTDSQGKKDFSSISDFWHKEILEMVKIFGTQAPAERQTSNPTPPPATTAPIPAPTTVPDPKTMSLPDRALSWISAKYGKLTHGDKNESAFFNIVKEGFALAVKQGAMETELQEIAKRCNELAVQEFIAIPPGQVFGTNGELVNSATGAFVGDDLPF